MAHIELVRALLILFFLFFETLQMRTKENCVKSNDVPSTPA